MSARTKPRGDHLSAETFACSTTDYKKQDENRNENRKAAAAKVDSPPFTPRSLPFQDAVVTDGVEP